MYPTARVVWQNGKLVLEDPEAYAVARVVENHNAGRALRALLEANKERIEHFARRVRETRKLANTLVIVSIDVDDARGSVLADALVPGADWQAYRSRGEKPIACGLAEREGVREFVKLMDPSAERSFGDACYAANETIPVVMITAGRASVFPCPLPPA